MEDRLPLLIQKRLEAEIKQHPPLFPWETEFEDYDIPEPDSGHSQVISIPTGLPEINSD